MNIAIYGKGGIGKSTITTCISAFLAEKGKKVLQIGCDPKHDSTLTLLNKKKIVTIIDSLDRNDLNEDELIVEGIHGIDCVEIGGPDPGVGCAGRGIISGLMRLEKMNKYKITNYDHVIYDILGDVVCGGFFEPLKKKKVQKMYIVTSGEFNSVFAANNLCKGYINCGLDKKGISLAGVIGNCRGIQREEDIISDFCHYINVPLVTLIPRDERIERCTMSGINIIDSDIGSEISRYISNIVSSIESDIEIKKVNVLSLEELRKMYERIIV